MPFIQTAENAVIELKQCISKKNQALEEVVWQTIQLFSRYTFTTKNAADTEAPSAPTNVVVTDVTTTTAKVTWSEATDNVGVVGYNVYLNETKVNDTIKRNKCKSVLTGRKELPC